MSHDKPKPLENELSDVEKREKKPADEKPPKFQPTDNPDNRARAPNDKPRRSQS